MTTYRGQNSYQCISSFINRLQNTDSFERTLGYRMELRNVCVWGGGGIYNHSTIVSECCRFPKPIFTFYFLQILYGHGLSTPVVLNISTNNNEFCIPKTKPT